MRRWTAVAAAVLTFAACSDPSGPRRVAPDQLRLAIVSGDGQRAQVAAAVPAAGLVALTDDYELFPEPLIVQVTDTAGRALSRDELPPNTAVGWSVLDAGCGEPFTDMSIPDADGRAGGWVVRGTKAGPCRVEARGVMGLLPVVYAQFNLELLPGPVVAVSSKSPPAVVTAGDSVWIPDVLAAARDAHFNSIPLSALHEHGTVAWAWRARDAEDPAQPEGSGWATRVPAEAGTWPRTTFNAVLYLWFNGAAGAHSDGVVLNAR